MIGQQNLRHALDQYNALLAKFNRDLTSHAFPRFYLSRFPALLQSVSLFLHGVFLLASFDIFFVMIGRRYNFSTGFITIGRKAFW